MALRKLVSLVVVFAAIAALPSAWAQDAQPAQQQPATTASDVPEGGVPRYIRPETPEQRRTRLGTAEDPGPNPDRQTVFFRFGKQYTIDRYDKKWARYDAPEGWVRPFAPVNFAKEIYQENDKYVWVWQEVRETNPAPVEDNSQYTESSDEEIKYFEGIRHEFSDFTPPVANVRIRFEEASNGLPKSGSWRNSLAVADMNEDGHVDLIFPPQRGVESAPSIYLGDGNGGWKFWQIEWPMGFNYGSVIAADFNKDKHMDLAFGIHLTGVRMFLGDGKGKFTDASQGLPMDFPTRRVVTTDLNGDGWTDIVAISEGPVARGAEAVRTVGGNLRGYLNRKKGTSWEQVDIAQMGQYVGGDWLAVGNFNGDKVPDFFGSSIYFNGVDMLFLSEGSGAKSTWKVSTDRTLTPFLSYYFANTAGRFTPAKTDDAIVSYIRAWPTDLSPKLVPTPPLTTIVGIDRISFSGKTPKRTPIARWGSSRALWGLGRGDFDADGNQDLVYTVFDPREAAVLLGDGAGNFKRATVEGVTLPGTINYDLTVADVNRDNRPDLIVMYESDETTAFSPKNGKVQVFLNRGASKVEQP